MKMLFTNKSVLLSLVIASLLQACSDANNKVLAEVNGRNVTQSEVKAYLKHKHIPVKAPARVEKAIDNYLQREGLADVIEEQDLLDKEMINMEIKEFRKQMVISRYMEKYLSGKVTEEAVKNFYATNKERFQTRKVHVAHILIRANSKMSEEEIKALSTKAQEVHSRVTSDGDFEKLAAKYSDDKMSAKKGGDLGWITEGAIDPLFSKTTFAMKKDEISDPVRTPFGFHIIKCLDESKVEQKPFEKTRGTIRYELRQKAKQAEIKRLNSLIKIEKKEKFNVES